MKKLVLVIVILLVLIIGVFGIKYYNEKPIIKLVGDDNILLNVNEKYKDEGATASVHKKDLTSSITVDNKVDYNKVGKYDITYNLKYHNRKYNIKRTIEVLDKEVPSIELTGEEVIITEGEKYTELGYKANDNYDGDITNKVEISNNIDTSKPGTYEVKYVVKDDSGNETIKTRKVTVKEKQKVVADTSTTVVSNKTGTGHGVPILMYHYFYDSSAKTDEKINDNYVEIKNFEKQMKYLHDNNYYFPSWKELADYIDGKINLPEKSVIVTCDDGHKSFFDLAIPILNKYNIKATGFIITSKPSAQKIPKYKSENIIFESHTHDMHKAGCTGGRGGLFRCISHDKGVADLKESIRITGSNDVIAYPFGDITANTLSITKDAGFKIGVTIKYGRAKKGMDKLQLPRVRVSKGTSINSFIGSL